MNNVYVIENGFETENINIPKEPYWKDDKVRLVYTGTIYNVFRDPSPLFEAVINIAKSSDSYLLDKLEVIFAGNAGNLMELVNKYKVSKWVKYLGVLPREDVIRMQRDAHALIF